MRATQLIDNVFAPLRSCTHGFRSCAWELTATGQRILPRESHPSLCYLFRPSESVCSWNNTRVKCTIAARRSRMHDLCSCFWRMILIIAGEKGGLTDFAIGLPPDQRTACLLGSATLLEPPSDYADYLPTAVVLLCGQHVAI